MNNKDLKILTNKKIQSSIYLFYLLNVLHALNTVVFYSGVS